MLGSPPTVTHTRTTRSGREYANYSGEVDPSPPQQVARAFSWPKHSDSWRMQGESTAIHVRDKPASSCQVTQPFACRMENITWRMMALALQKQKRKGRRNVVDIPSSPTQPPVPDTVIVKQESPLVLPPDLGATESSRRIDKGHTTNISVVDFDADSVGDSLAWGSGASPVTVLAKPRFFSLPSISSAFRSPRPTGQLLTSNINRIN
jgi:hypothetical protein